VVALGRSFDACADGTDQGYFKRRDALLAAGKHPSQHTIKATGLLLDYVGKDSVTEAALKRTECLLRLLLESPKAA
jgi:hypothetical protein